MVEKKKLIAELLRVQAAKAELDYLIEQKLEEIQRLKDAIEKQTQSEMVLSEKLKALGG
jgi:hypothetical protein